MIDSIEARQAREEAESRRVGRDAIADAGPHLADDDGTIVIPSPNYHKAFASILNVHGFHFEHGLCAWWERDITKPFNGRTHTPAQWLDWATRRYEWAWPNWKKTDDGRID